VGLGITNVLVAVLFRWWRRWWWWWRCDFWWWRWWWWLNFRSWWWWRRWWWWWRWWTLYGSAETTFSINAGRRLAIVRGYAPFPRYT